MPRSDLVFTGAKVGNRNYFVYILKSDKSKVLYVGVTNDLKKRVYEHKSKAVEGFTKKYNINWKDLYDDI